MLSSVERLESVRRASVDSPFHEDVAEMERKGKNDSVLMRTVGVQREAVCFCDHFATMK